MIYDVSLFCSECNYELDLHESVTIWRADELLLLCPGCAFEEVN